MNQGCGECLNPLIEIKPFQFKGDIPSFEEYYGWDQAKKGEEAE